MLNARALSALAIMCGVEAAFLVILALQAWWIAFRVQNNFQLAIRQPGLYCAQMVAEAAISLIVVVNQIQQAFGRPFPCTLLKLASFLDLA
jgi:hypothetical protein